MANSGSFNTNKINVSSTVGDRYLTFSWSVKEQDIANNKTTISWTLKGAGGNSKYYYMAGNFKVVINGDTVYSSTTRIELYGDTVVAKGEKTITHSSDGSKSFKASAEAGIYNVAVNSTGNDTFDLPDIPRYATSKQSLNSKTETSIKIDWSSDSTIDYIWYSKDNGSNWTGINVTDGKSGSYTISGLSANTTYKIKTRVRRKDSQLTTDSSALSVTTYDYPYCTDSPNFVLGDALTLKFYNPLGRTFKFYIIGNGTQIDVEYTSSGTTYTGVNSTATSVPYLYNTIPNAKSGKYQVKVVYGTSTKTRNNGNTYSIVEKDCYPTFTTFTYKDTNTTVTNITGNDQLLVRGKSNLSVYISSANKMVAKNGATPKRYNINIDTISNNKNYATTDITIPVGVVSASGTKRLSVRAYDSRELSTLAYKDITVLDYKDPVINVSLKRYNNFEAQTTLKVSGTYSRLTINNVDKNTITDVSYRYREKGGDWSGWSPLTTTLSSGKFTCSDVLFTLDNQKAFEFEIKATDKLSAPSVKATVDIGQAVFFVSSNMRKAYVNGEEVATNDNVMQTKYYTQIAENSDLNGLVTIGTYRSIQASHSATMKNVPAGINGGFTLHVLTWTATATNTEYRRQELIYARTTYTRHTTNGGLTWSEWITTATLENFYPVDAVCCSSTNENPSGRYGGTWELIGKGFKASLSEDTSIFTPYANPKDNTSNVFVVSSHIMHNDSTIRIRLGIRTTDTMSDTGKPLGTLNFNKIGITSLDMSYLGQVTFSDGANGGIVWNLVHNTGELNQIDVISPSGLKDDNAFYIDLNILTRHTKMIDSFCDKFYWKRTA